jgi:threonine dehydrogenase-like Zn-dependent dehydrogenase
MGPQGSAVADDGTAVVLGAGGMGLLHVALLRALFPALKILCMDLRLDRLSVASKLGATGISTPGQMAAEGLLADLSAGLGADVVFDTVGGAEILNQALELSREGGTVVLFAHAPADQRAGFDLNGLFKYERRVIGTYSGGIPEQRIVQRLLESRVFDPSRIVTHRMPLSHFERAVALARANEALKILLVPDEDV